jgi:hypothetical protein
MVMQTINKSPAGVSNALVTPAGLSEALLGLPNKAQARAQGKTAIVCAAVLATLGALILIANAE